MQNSKSIFKGGFIMRRKKIPNIHFSTPLGFYKYANKLGSIHLAEFKHSNTLCGIPMLAFNRAHHDSKRKELMCQDCLKELEL